MAVSVPIGAWAVIVTGQQVSSTEWTYTVTYEPFDNYAVATITLRGICYLRRVLNPDEIGR